MQPLKTLMSTMRIGGAITAAGLLCSSFPAKAEQTTMTLETPSLKTTAGVRLWQAQWDSWYTNDKAEFNGTRYRVVEALDNHTKLATIPYLSVRYGKLFATTSKLLQTNYSFESAIPNTFYGDNRRSEFDINLGYAFSTGINLTLGRKRVQQTLVQGDFQGTATAKGLVLGLNATAPLSQGWGLYGSVGLGLLKYQLPPVAADARNNTHFDIGYQLVEAGLSYTLPASHLGLTAITFTSGYRAQKMTIKDFGLDSISGTGVRQFNRNVDLTDSTQGFVIGVQGSF